MGLKKKNEAASGSHNRPAEVADAIQGSEPILTIEQVADRLQLKPSTVYELTRRRNRRPVARSRLARACKIIFSADASTQSTQSAVH
jgi:hypothetical protein